MLIKTTGPGSDYNVAKSTALNAVNLARIHWNNTRGMFALGDYLQVWEDLTPREKQKGIDAAQATLDSMVDEGILRT